jgi:cytochrome c5
MIAANPHAAVALVLASLAPGPAFAAAGTDGPRAWQATCKDCHANPDSDAPQLANRAAWAPRLAKGAAALYASALGGLKGPLGTEMPARGGNRSLTDDEVRAAVDYMMRTASTTPERKSP